VLSAISEIGGVLHLYKMLRASSVSDSVLLTVSILLEGIKFKHFSLPKYVEA